MSNCACRLQTGDDGFHAEPLELCAAHRRWQREAVEKTTTYLQQENEVLIERVRLLEISLSSEREACAKVAEDYGIARYLYEAEGNGGKQDAKTAAEAIASLIRGRGER